MKKITEIPKKLSYLVILAFVAVGCASAGANLEPATFTPKTQIKDAIKVTGIDGVSMTVQADTWPGDPGVTAEVTPLKVAIHNNSDMPVVVSYNNFAIVTPEGKYHAAIPPFIIKGKAGHLELAEYYKPINTHLIHQNFKVAPIYGSVYDIDVYNPYGHYDYDYYDYSYYNAYDKYWKNFAPFKDYNKPKPTGRMLVNAIPEGVIMPGGMIQGFLYFQKVDAEKSDLVRFTALLQNADTGQLVGVISIPYNVEMN